MPVVCMKDRNNSKRQKLAQAATHVSGVVSSCRPVFRHLNLSPLQSCDAYSMSHLPQLPGKLQALYYQLASATTLVTLPAQVSSLQLQSSNIFDVSTRQKLRLVHVYSVIMIFILFLSDAHFSRFLVLS